MASPNKEEQTIVIAGAGIVGLVLALALKKHIGVVVELYEQADAFVDDVGAGMGMYPNGLRVLRDVDPQLVESIQTNGRAYLYRRWERHDGTEVAVADETVLSDGDDDLQSIGIRRWRLQKILYEAVVKAGITIHFGKRISNIVERNENGLVELVFQDGTHVCTEILFAADGSRSQVRQCVCGDSHQLEYTGVTCLMGMSEVARETRGIYFPSADTTGCHAVFFPTGAQEQCFQFHFPIEAKDADQGNWGTLSQSVGQEECKKLHDRLEKDGWDEKYLTPLTKVSNAVRIGFCLLEPGLKQFVFDNRIVLLGDAAHPPVPYIGQGAQMGLEDAGVVAMLMKKMCLDDHGNFSKANFGAAMKVYEKMRIPRTTEMLDRGKDMGLQQQKRASSNKFRNGVKEVLLQRQVFYHETLPVMFPGAKYNYKEDVLKVLETEPAILPVLQEEEEEEKE